MTLIAVGVAGVAEITRRLNNYILNPYRVESTGDLLVAFMEKHDRWPADWGELQRFVESGGHTVYGVRTFQELRNNVMIDFSFDPKSASLADAQRLHVIAANDGTVHGATHDPNAMIFDYLNRKRRP